MDKTKDVLLLIGSPKGNCLDSTSYVLGKHVINNLRAENINSEVISIPSHLKSDSQIKKFLNKIERADTLLLSSPLYVDTLPAPVTQALELIKESSKIITNSKNKELMVIVNCGFPESSQNRVAIQICEQFALETGMAWLGGLAVGMGGSLSGKVIPEQGGKAKEVKEALDFLTVKIIQSEKIPEDKLPYEVEPNIPGWLYTFIGNLSWRVQALKNGCYKLLNNKPFV